MRAATPLFLQSRKAISGLRLDAARAFLSLSLSLSVSFLSNSSGKWVITACACLCVRVCVRLKFSTDHFMGRDDTSSTLVSLDSTSIEYDPVCTGPAGR